MSNTDNRTDQSDSAADDGPADDAINSADPAHTDAGEGSDDAVEAKVVTDAEVADAIDGESSDSDEPERLYTKIEVDKLLAQAAESRLRIQAEYDNYRRRTAREKQQWIADALEGFVKDLLPVFDSFDKARDIESGADAVADAGAAMREGLEVTQKLLRGVLGNYSIEVIDPVGEPFDPTFHEALMRQSSPDHEAGTVITVFERGYTISGRLVRPARTVVASE